MGGRPASSGSRLWAAAVIVAMSLLALVACGDEEPASQARVVSPGTGDSVTGVTITQVPTPTSTSDPLLASPVYRIEAAGQPQSPLELRIKAQDSRWIVYWDEAVRLWIPVESQRDGAELVAQVDHLSLWSTMVDGIDWLSTGAFRFLGDRALPPECTGTAPSWVTSFDTEPGNHPRLLSCRGGQQDDAILRISNNRGYPLWVTFSNGSTSLSPRSVEVGWPSGFDELVRLGFGTVLGSGRTYLAPGQTLTATFAQPQSPPRTGRVEVHGTLDAPLLAFHMIMEVLSAKDLVDIPVGDGKMLGAKALECYVKLPLGTVGVFVQDQMLTALNSLRECLSLTVEGDVNRLRQLGAQADPTQLNRLVGLSRVLWGMQVAKWGQQLWDASLLDKELILRDQAVSYLGYTAKEPPPPPCPAGTKCLGQVTADLNGDRQPDQLGLYLSNGTKMARAVVSNKATDPLTFTEEDIASLPRPPLEVIGVVDADGDGSEEVILKTGKGGNSFYPTGIVKLDGAGLVLVGEEQSGGPPSFTADFGLQHIAGFQCGPIGPDGKPRLTVSQAEYKSAGDSFDLGEWTWETRQYRWQGASIILEKRDLGTVAAGPSWEDAQRAKYGGISCAMRN